jgi:hypothetical protein
MQQTQFRVAGAALALAAVFVLDLGQSSALHKLWLPGLLALGIYLMTFSIMAVALTCGALAALHLDLNSSSWIQAKAYPLVAAISILVAGGIGVLRFRKHIAQTHEARWAGRRGNNEECVGDKSNGDDIDNNK